MLSLCHSELLHKIYARPLASVAVARDRYSLGYSAAREFVSAATRPVAAQRRTDCRKGVDAPSDLREQTRFLRSELLVSQYALIP
jgi:hypothetical protein